MSTFSCTDNGDGTSTCIPNSLVNDGDAAWMLTSTAIVYMMTPGVGFFYGGLVGNRNIINTIIMSVVCMGIVTVQWNLVGYSWAFGPTQNKVWGSFDWAALRFDPSYPDCASVTTESSWTDQTACFNAYTYPLAIHSAFQCAFAVITPALISGSIIGRMKFVPYCLFILMWSSFCYDGLACWVWNFNGWLHTLGALDFAGGTVVHISSATAGLTACIILGKRHDWKFGHTSKPPNVPFVVLGASLLWVGWMGFNAGSALAANSLAGTALVNTNGAAASAMMMWVFLDSLRGHVSVAGACSGIVVGLVAITPACGFVHPGYGLLIGIIATSVVYPAQILWRKWMRVDDTLDVFTCHGLGGMTGAICTGLFCDAHWNTGAIVDGAPIEGAFFGHGVQLGYQLAAIVTTLAWSSACTTVILGILYLIFGGLRPSLDEEMAGLDKSAHGEDWEIAAQMDSLLGTLAEKDKEVNGMRHHMNDGTISMDYRPNSAMDKPVHVELAVSSPGPKVDGVEDQLVTLDRQSSTESLNGSEYEQYKSPTAESKPSSY